MTEAIIIKQLGPALISQAEACDRLPKVFIHYSVESLSHWCDSVQLELLLLFAGAIVSHVRLKS